MKNVGDIFFAGDLVFENGVKDVNMHPVLVVGKHEDKLYCCQMTSQTKHITDKGREINLFNQFVKYVEIKPNVNAYIANNKTGLVNTTKVHVLDASEYKDQKLCGRITKGSVLDDIKTQYVFQQQQLFPEEVKNYDEICRACFINTDRVVASEKYKYIYDLMMNNCKPLMNSLLHEYDKYSRLDKTGLRIIKGAKYNTYPPQNGQSISNKREYVEMLKRIREEAANMKKAAGDYEYYSTNRRR